MCKQRMQLSLIILLFYTISVRGTQSRAEAIELKDFSSETEISVDKTSSSESQYIFLTRPRWNGFARAYNVDPDGPLHGEFEIGPTFNLGRFGEFQTSVGATTDGSITTNYLWILFWGSKHFIYNIDPKWYVFDKKRPHELFHKLILPQLFSIKGIPVTLRGEQLFLDYKTSAFLRIGPQFALFPVFTKKLLGPSATFSFSPYYDFDNHAVGTFFTLTVVP